MMLDPYLESLLTVLGVIGLGGFTARFVQWLGQRSNQKHQLFLDIAKHKFESIHKASNEYMLMASALAGFLDLVSKKDERNAEKFYYISKFFYHHQNIAYSGGFELENRDGEEVVTLLIGEIFKVFDVLHFEEISNMSDLVLDEKSNLLRFNKFRTRELNPHFKNFVEEILNDHNNSKNLETYCRWLIRVLMFEINTAYRQWYKDSPKFPRDNDLFKYLIKNEFANYVNRLIISNLDPFEKLFHTKRKYF